MTTLATILLSFTAGLLSHFIATRLQNKDKRVKRLSKELARLEKTNKKIKKKKGL